MKFYSYLFLLLFFSLGTHSTAQATIPFVTTWKTDGFDPSNKQITIPTIGGGYNYTVDWGDGTTSVETGDATHVYATPGTYTVSITGDFPRIYFGVSGENEKIMTIEQWGDNNWSSMEYAFQECTNLQGNFIDVPDLSGVTSLNAMFSWCSLFNSDIGNWDISNVTIIDNMFNNAVLFNQDIGSWDVSNVTSMNGVFFYASNFNQDIGSWDVSNVIGMAGIFTKAELFNQDIGGWDVSSVVDMDSMFSQAIAFNQDIGNWNVGNVFNMSDMFYLNTIFNQDIGGWDVSSVSNMNNMFRGATSFDQDIGSWDVSSVSDMNNMFGGAISFNQDLGPWDVSSLTDATEMFVDVTLSTSNYDSLLIGWNSRSLQSNINFHGGFSIYCAGMWDRANMVANDMWEIIDGGLKGPKLNDLDDQTVPNSFTLPVIGGADLLGSEKYYTGRGGTGTEYSSGDVINYNDFPSYPVILYIYDSASACSLEQNFKLRITTVPLCTSLISPLSGAKDVLLGADLMWGLIDDATGYRLLAGTSSGGVDIINDLDVGMELTYDLPVDLPMNTQIYVTVIPYNLVGDAVSCMEESFITEDLDLRPSCTTLSSPLSSVNLFWYPVADALGYMISVGTYSTGSDLESLYDVGDVLTYDLPIDLPENTQIFVTITPYNNKGPALGCPEEAFTTEELIILPPKFFSPNNDRYNDYWRLDERITRYYEIQIFDRFGKNLKILKSTDKGWDGVFNGSMLPAADYWYVIYLENKIPITGHFSLIR